MANGTYVLGLGQLADNTFDWLTDTIKAVLVDTGAYTVNLTTHDFLDDVAAGARIATATLTGKTSAISGSSWVLDADDTTFTAVSGVQSEALIIYKDSGAEATSPLLLYIDTGTGLPITPNGADIIVQWPATGIWTLT